MTRKVRATYAIAVSILFFTSFVRASEPPRTIEASEGPWVQLEMASADFGEELGRSIAADLRAGLMRRGIEVGGPDDAPARPPIARIQLTTDADGIVAIDIEDAVTAKRVGRRVDARAFPPDGRSLALAVAIEELLQASWAELSVARSPRRPEHEAEAPPPVVAPTEKGAGRPPPNEWSLHPSVVAYGGGHAQAGGELAYLRWFGARLGLRLSIRLLAAWPVATEVGTITTRSLGGGIDLAVSLLQDPRWFLDALVGAHAFEVAFRGRPDGNVDALPAASLAVYGRAGLRAGSRALAPALVGLEASFGAPLRTVAAYAGDARATAVAGWEGRLALLVGVSF